jgi:uncharacterized protein YndB with AHSA1/START domain
MSAAHFRTGEVLIMLHTEATLIISQPIEQVFWFVSNLENRPLWCAGTLETKQTSQGTNGVGTSFHEVFELFLGKKGEADYRITEYEANKRLVFVSTSGPMQIMETLTFEAAEGKTRITQTTDANFNRFKITEPLFKGMGQRMLVANLSRLRDQLER